MSPMAVRYELKPELSYTYNLNHILTADRVKK